MSDFCAVHLYWNTSLRLDAPLFLCFLKITNFLVTTLLLFGVTVMLLIWVLIVLADFMCVIPVISTISS